MRRRLAGFIVGLLVGAVAGVGLAVLAGFLWYTSHCGQVPLFGGAYCR
jgi:hypothetical protein